MGDTITIQQQSARRHCRPQRRLFGTDGGKAFGGDENAWAAFDPKTVITKHAPYEHMSAWLAVAAQTPTVQHAASRIPPSNAVGKQ
jgi:S-formylglutathione hydrolase FrmB